VDRLIVVDGYNLILRSPRLRPEPGRSLREAREKLVNLLSWAVGGGDAEFIVVFDGAEGGGPNERDGRVDVRFSRPPEKADDEIRRIVEDRVDQGRSPDGGDGGSRGRSSCAGDGRRHRALRSLPAERAGSGALRRGGGQQAEEEKPTMISKKELEEWAQIFRAPRPGEERPRKTRPSTETIGRPAVVASRPDSNRTLSGPISSASSPCDRR
jgi:hypothetical protein